jgi:hypothetical protein
MIAGFFGRKRRADAQSSRLTDVGVSMLGPQGPGNAPPGVVATSDGATTQLPDDEYTVPPEMQGEHGGVHPLEMVRADAREAEAAALERLSRVHGPGERKAVILALIMTPRSHREKTAWREETATLADAEALREATRALTRLTRLPVWETLLRETASAPLEERRDLLAGARRVMSADGHVRAMDRLHWLAMRHLLGQGAEKATLARAGVREDDLSSLSDPARRDVATYSAFLARLVPAIEAGSHLVGATGADWHRRIVATLWPAGDGPPCKLPDTDALVSSLRGVQKMSWMLRPQLVRLWVTEAVARSPGGWLAAEAADALRLSCVLLDAPLPPPLAACFIEWPREAAAPPPRPGA